MKDKNYIDNLFEKELGAYEIGTASQGWAAVATGLTKKGLLSLIKSSLWFKLVAGICTLGLITFLTIISINADVLKNDKADIIICDPTIENSTITNSQPIQVSPNKQNITNINQTRNLESHLIQDPKLNQISNNITPTINSNLNNTDIENPLHKTHNTLTVKNSEHDQTESAITNNQTSNNIISKKDKNINLLVANRNIESGDNETKDIVYIDENNSRSDINKDKFPGVEKIQEHEPIEISEVIKISTDDEFTEATEGETHDISGRNNLNSEKDRKPQIINSKNTDDKNEELVINNSKTTSKISTESKYLINPDIYDSQPEEFQPFSVSTRSEPSLMTQINALPFKGFEPLSQNLSQSFNQTHNFDTPSNLYGGYNPLNRVLSGWYSHHQLTGNTCTNDSQTELNLPFLNNGLENTSVINSGINIEARGKRLVLESGIGFMEINQPIEHNTIDYIFNYYTTWEYTNTTIFETFSDSIYNLIGTDTIWTVYSFTDSIVINDSTSTVHTDISQEEKTNKFTNTYKFIEIPLIIGYGLNTGRVVTTIKGGIITSFLWKSTTQNLSEVSSEYAYNFSRDKFPTTRFDLYTGLEAKYLVSSRYFIFGEAFYRQSINPIVLFDNISFHIKSYGLKLGAGFYF